MPLCAVAKTNVGRVLRPEEGITRSQTDQQGEELPKSTARSTNASGSPRWPTDEGPLTSRCRRCRRDVGRHRVRPPVDHQRRPSARRRHCLKRPRTTVLKQLSHLNRHLFPFFPHIALTSAFTLQLALLGFLWVSSVCFPP